MMMIWIVGYFMQPLLYSAFIQPRGVFKYYTALLHALRPTPVTSQHHVALYNSLGNICKKTNKRKRNVYTPR